MVTPAVLAPEASGPPEPRTPSSGILFSGLLHAAVAAVLVLLSLHRVGIDLSPPATPLLLGFLGPDHAAPNLEIPQPNAIRFRIYQRGQAGRERAASASLVLPDAKAVADKSRPPRDHRQARPDGIFPAKQRQRSAARPSPENGTAPEATEEAAAIAALEPDIALSEHFAITHMVKPVYPLWELERGVRARVLVTIRVSRDGQVEDAQIASAQAVPPGSTVAFELAAVEALRRWRFLLPHTPDYASGSILTVPVEYEPEDQDFHGLGRQLLH